MKLSKDKKAKLLNILAVNHSHSEMTQWALCKTCQDKFQEYKKVKLKMTEKEREELQKEIVRKTIDIMKMKDPRFLEVIAKINAENNPAQ